MNSDSVRAYDLPDRVRTYDADMEIMHPLRRKMVAIALEVIPFPETQNLKSRTLEWERDSFRNECWKPM